MVFAKRKRIKANAKAINESINAFIHHMHDYYRSTYGNGDGNAQSFIFQSHLIEQDVVLIQCQNKLSEYGLSYDDIFDAKRKKYDRGWQYYKRQWRKGWKPITQSVHDIIIVNQQQQQIVYVQPTDIQLLSTDGDRDAYVMDSYTQPVKLKKKSCFSKYWNIIWGQIIPVIDLIVSVLALIATIIIWSFAQNDSNIGGICCGLIHGGDDGLTQYAEGCTYGNIGADGMVYTTLTDGIAYCMTNEGVICNEGNGGQTLEQCMVAGGYSIDDVCNAEDMHRWYKDAQATILPLLGTATILLLIFFIVLSYSDLRGGDSKACLKNAMYTGCCCVCYRFICCWVCCVNKENWEKWIKVYGWIWFKIMCWIPPYIFAVIVEGMFANKFFNIYGNAENIMVAKDHPDRKIFNADPGFIHSSAVCAVDGSTVFVDYSQSMLVQEGAWIMAINDALCLFGLIRTCVGMAIGLILGCVCKNGYGDFDMMDALDLL